ncbi:MAG: hypothetical protein IJ141_02740 [Lachnospiraceae bacterium]|nr:hypothetical protein [Lachnospiraceae bacterium]
MNNIYRQLKEKFIMKDAFSDWKDYRESLTDIVSSYPGEKLAIVGAGRCNDIDVNRLYETFSGITLIDIDEEAMREGMAHLDDETMEKTEIKKLSVNGLYEEDIDAFCDELLNYVRTQGNNLTKEAYENKLLDMFDELKNKMLSCMELLDDRFIRESFDVVVCNGVFSQLFSMISYFVHSVSYSISDAGLFDTADIVVVADKKLSLINDEIIPVIIKGIICMAEKTVIFGNEYNKAEGAYQCIKFIKDNYEADEKIIRWNFNSKEKTEYDMLIQIIN